MTTTIYTSEQNINIDRYSSVLYYETMDIYTSEFKDLIENGFFDGDKATKDGITECSVKKERSNKCDIVKDRINKVFDNPPPDNTINKATLGIDIFTNIIFKRLFENSLK
jgi:hypothetical protein